MSDLFRIVVTLMLLQVEASCRPQPVRSTSILDTELPKQGLEKDTGGVTCDSRTSTKFQKLIEDGRSYLHSFLEKLPVCSQEDSAHSPFYDLCLYNNISFQPAPVKTESEGQRILVFDSTMHVPAYTRHKSRVLDFLETDTDGQLVRVREKLSVNSAVFKMTDYLDHNFSGFPSDFFADLFPTILQKLEKRPFSFADRPEEPSLSGGHGTRIFTKLAEYNPNAQFVLAEWGSLENMFSYIGLERCILNQNSQWEEKLRTYFSNQASGIIEIAKKYKLNFANFSFSNNVQYYLDSLKRNCPQGTPNLRPIAEKILAIEIEEFIKPVYENPDLIVVQAIGSENYNLASVRRDNAIDCQHFGNSLRVAAASHVDSGISKDGSENLALISPKFQQSTQCMDIVINMGPHAEMDNEGNTVQPECGVKFSMNGISRGLVVDESGISSSYAAPLAISYLIYLKNTLPSGTSNQDLVKIATGDGKKIVRDPIRHEQIEAYRLGFLDPKNSQTFRSEPIPKHR